MTDPTWPRGTRGGAFGNLLTVLFMAGLIGLGIWLLWQRDAGAPTPDAADASPAAGRVDDAAGGSAPVPAEPMPGLPVLAPPAAYQADDGVVAIDISEYAGYAGLIVANGGLAPNPESFFAREYGFQVRLTMSESETWSRANNGELAATATTVDALAVLGRQFDAVVPVLIGYSRGADMVVVDRGITSVNQLAGKVLAASQFNESEFFIRYLADEAGVPVTVLRDLDARPAPGALGLVFYEDAFVACDAYAHELDRNRPRLNGCVGWTPRTDEVIEASAERAKALVTNRNLLVVADVLAVNGGFARANPAMARGLVHGVLEGNRLLRDTPDAYLDTVAQAFGWTLEDARSELQLVHLANLPENLAFFAGTIDAAGSFGGIFQSSVLAYGDILRNPTDPERFIERTHLEALAAEGRYTDQRIAIAPIRSPTGMRLEGDPLLSKDIRFFFEPNSAQLEADSAQNLEYLATIKRFLQVSPGSIVLLRGHVDDALVPQFRQQGGEEFVNRMALAAMELSRNRSLAVRDALLENYPEIARDRLETVGRGWEEPAGPDSDLNRRVEAQWFTLE